jgi:nucleotide-binding universal stress UspA family protein
MVEPRVGTGDAPLAPDWSLPGKSVVVGVDGSERNRAAITWAVADAVAARRPLELVHVLDERRVPNPIHGLETDDQRAWRLLESVEAEVRAQAPDLVVRTDVAVGAAGASLVDRSADQAALVVGRRGLGRFVRLLIGSTSLDVASRAEVPVVVVPDRWATDDHLREPVVVGVDRRDLQPSVIRFAFAEANARRVPLVAAHGRDLPAGETDALDGGVDVEQALAPYRAEYPEVDASVVDLPSHPLSVLLDEVRPAQLVVLGRHRDRGHGGFPFGSVAHGVLYYADVPVAIVPTRG